MKTFASLTFLLSPSPSLLSVAMIGSKVERFIIVLYAAALLI